MNYVIKEGEDTMIYYQNGMKNEQEIAKETSTLLRDITGQSVGLIHNDTDGLVGDVVEYIPEGYTTKDVLNAKVLEDISKNGEAKNLVVAFSAGNEDANKALGVLALEGRTLENKVEIMSVGSPVSKSELEKNAKNVGVTVVGQYNDWKDPVTNAKTWGTSVVAVGLAGAIVGVSSVGLTSAATGIETFFNLTLTGAAGAAGAAVLAGIGKYNLGKYHSLERYMNDDVQGIKVDLQEWVKKNRPDTVKTKRT
jgi:hypothetical protein